MVNISFKDIFAPAFWQAWNDFLQHKYTEMWFTGGRGCIAADTLIATPSGPVPVQDFKGGTIYAYDGESLIQAHAFPAERFTQEDLYTVTLDDGSSITVTDQHKFLTPSDGWIMTKNLQPGSQICVAQNSSILDSIADGKPKIGIPDQFKFNIVDKTLFEREEDALETIDTLTNWTDYFIVPEGSRFLRPATVVSVQFSHKEYYYDVFVPVYNNYLTANGILNHNSTKSSFVSMCIVLGLIRDSLVAYAHKKAGDRKWMSYLTHAIVYRKVAADLRISVYNQFIWSIEKLGLTHKFRFSMSPLRIVYTPTGQMIDFRGLDDPIKSKSIKAPFGYYKYNFFEELNQFDGMEEVRSVRQSIERGGRNGREGGYFSFCCFNPPQSVQNWANFEARKVIPGRHVYHSDYRSVPREWLSDQFFETAEILRMDNEQKYRHEYLGEATGNGGNIFSNIVDIRITDEQIEQHHDDMLWGCDFGLTDPTVLCGCWYDKMQRDLYCAVEVYRSGMLLDEIESRFKTAHFGWNYIMADSASPQMIRELENRGIPILPVVKYRDSIRHGISWLQSLRHIYIDQTRCPNGFEELTLYEFEKLKGTDCFTDRPIAGHDHYIDSLRYATSQLAQDAGLF